VKVRGTAAHIADKYLSLARDAQSSGDIIAAENYLQHAEHYSRIVMAAQAQYQQERQMQYRDAPEEGYDDDRQTNGRGRERFEYNGEGGDRSGEEEGEERFESREGDADRGYRPRPPRSDRPDYYERRDRYDRDRQDYQERERPRQFERSGEREPPPERQPEPQPEPQPAPQSAAEEQPTQSRRRRGRPSRNDNGGEAAADGDSTPDGAAALAAFPD
jgi:hypothetical protein